MTAPTSQTDKLPIVPSEQGIIKEDTKSLISLPWIQWFLALSAKINTINVNSVGWSGVPIDSGVAPGEYGDSTHYPTFTVNANGLLTLAGQTSFTSGGGNATYVNLKSGSYTLVLGDIPAASSYKGAVGITNSASNTLTIPLNSAVAYPVGAEITGIQLGTGATTFYSTSGVALEGPTITAGGQYAQGKATKISTNTWVITGQLGFTSGATYQSTVLADSPLLFYMLNETSGTTATNLGSFSSANATYTGGYTLNESTGRTGIPSGVLLNGTSGYLVTGSIALNTGFTAYTIEYWIIPKNITANQRVSDFANNLSTDISSGNTDMIVNGAVPVSGTCPAANPSAAYHFVFTGDGTSQKIYVNNVLLASSVTAYSNSATTDAYYIGQFSSGGYFSNCIMAGHAVYNHALTTTRIAAHYTAGS